jgi:hypothetical protein
MCMKEEKTRSSASKQRIPSRDASPVSVSSDSSADSYSRDGSNRTLSGVDNIAIGPLSYRLDAKWSTVNDGINATRTDASSSSLLRYPRRREYFSFPHLTAGTVASVAVVAFALFFPFRLAPQAALQTYHFAKWKYVAEISHFDNTAWTYATDYLLAVCMLLLIAAIPCRTTAFRRAGWCARGLLASYMISVTAGGLAHQFFTTVDSQNTVEFRILWTVCVGAVAAASGFMGVTATELLYLDHGHTRGDSGVDIVLFRGKWQRRWTLPVIPESFWVAYAVCVTAIVVAGGFSFQRPACDIFFVGITQFPSTFFMMIILSAGLQKYGAMIGLSVRLRGCLGFILNAPLLPLYPLLVQYTDWSLGFINTLLHTWLLIAWTLQGWTLRHVGHAVGAMEQRDAQLSESLQVLRPSETRVTY